MFQEDIYPPCLAGEPSLTAAEWVSGMNKDPKLLAFSRDGLSPTSGGPKVSCCLPRSGPVAILFLSHCTVRSTEGDSCPQEGGLKGATRCTSLYQC